MSVVLELPPTPQLRKLKQTTDFMSVVLELQPTPLAATEITERRARECRREEVTREGG
ncbi:MAG TPA: hypothetical protein VF251_13120 [Pyrinomonadaceae bacterium]